MRMIPNGASFRQINKMFKDTEFDADRICIYATGKKGFYGWYRNIKTGNWLFVKTVEKPIKEQGIYGDIMLRKVTSNTDMRGECCFAYTDEELVAFAREFTK